MLKKIFISCLLLVVTFSCFYTTICYATPVKVTKDNLNTTFQKFVSSDLNEENYKISVSEDTITVISNEGTYALKYDLTNKPTFTYEISVAEGMSYEEFQKITNDTTIIMLPYIAVANIQGAEIEDIMTYFGLCLLEFMSGSFSIGNSQVINEEEFKNHVMEYVNSLYKEKKTFKDSDGINSFEWTTEQKDVTSTSCKLVSTLKVNVDADFSKLKEYANRVEDSIINKNITKENADYVITLKVGQKCKIESSEKINGYSLSGYDCIDFSSDYTEITAKSVGVKNGYLSIGDTDKSIYITVEENAENKTLDAIILKIGKTTDNDVPDKKEDTTTIPDKSKKEENKNNEINKDNTTTSSSKLPQTGINNTIFIVIMISIIYIIVAKIKLKKYKDIK